MSPRRPLDLYDALLPGPALVIDLSQATGLSPRVVEANLKVWRWQGKVDAAPGPDGRIRWRLAGGAR